MKLFSKLTNKPAYSNQPPLFHISVLRSLRGGQAKKSICQEFQMVSSEDFFKPEQLPCSLSYTKVKCSAANIGI